MALGVIEYDRPPTPPLARANIFIEPSGTVDIEEEKWDDGMDEKWKSFQQIRREKRRFWAQQKELAKQAEEMSKAGENFAMKPKNEEEDLA